MKDRPFFSWRNLRVCASARRFFCAFREDWAGETLIGKRGTWRPIFLFFHLFIFFFFACQRQQNPQDIVVRVDSETLTVLDIANEIPLQFRGRITKSELQDYVTRWTDSQILFQEAKRRRLDQSESVRRELRRLERELVVNMLLEQELNKPFPLSEDEIEKYYNDNRQNFVRSTKEVRVWYLKVEKKERADSLVAALREGVDFLQMARHYNAGDSAEWDLYLTEEETAPTIASAVFTMMPGAVSRPIPLEDGFHIFKMIEKYEVGSLQPLASVRGKIEARIQSEKRQERYKQLLAEFKNTTVIEKNLFVLDSLSMDAIFARATSGPQGR
jgi:parvulin-like peptidyl-prolyl isomerase